MKILTNKKIKQLFIKISIYILIFLLISLYFIYSDFQSTRLYLISILCMYFGILTALYQYFSEQNKTIENAEKRINEYISGNTVARIECDYEGELYKLFHKVNSLAAILNAHAENELKSKEFLKEAISNISHQLKTPLAALNIYNGIIQSEAGNSGTVKEFSSLSEQELDRIENLVQNLLKITKLDAGTIIIDKTKENIFEIMKEIENRFSFQIKRDGKKITLSGKNNIFLYCDRNWFMEAIANIVKNALDHTTTGEIIAIEWKQFPSMTQIIIKDNGSGIHPDDMPHIFKRFYRSRFSKDIQGIGLGLPLVKAIIEAHNGSIEVDSELGAGTTFIMNFIITTKL